MDSSKSFDHRAPSAAAKQPPRFADRSRFRGYRGGVIAMHRALARFVLEPLDLVTAALLVVLFTFVWIAALPWVCRFWQAVDRDRNAHARAAHRARPHRASVHFVHSLRDSFSADARNPSRFTDMVDFDGRRSRVIRRKLLLLKQVHARHVSFARCSFPPRHRAAVFSLSARALFAFAR